MWSDSKTPNFSNLNKRNTHSSIFATRITIAVNDSKFQTGINVIQLFPTQTNQNFVGEEIYTVKFKQIVLIL